MGLKFVSLIGLILGMSAANASSPPLQNAHLKEILLRVGSSLYLNPEFGLIYSKTSVLPATLDLMCAREEKVASDNSDLVLCGQVKAEIFMESYGLSAFFLDYTRRNPLKIRLHVNPHEAYLGDLAGVYVGGRIGGGLVLGARGMLLINSTSGIFATTTQRLSSLGGMNSPSAGVHIGVDVSVPWIQVAFDRGVDLSKPVSSLVTL